MPVTRASRFIRRLYLPALASCLTVSLTALWLVKPPRLSTMVREQTGCVESLERLLLASGWRGREEPYWLQLSKVEDRKTATEACRLQTATRVIAAEDAIISEHCFAEKLSRQDRQKSMRHLAVVATQLEAAGIEFYLDMGTALGAFRHFQMIPYDEDVDIRINIEQKEVAKSLLSKLRYTWPQLLFQDTEWKNQHWKVHFRDTMDPVLELHVALDIFFYTVNRTSSQLLIREPPFIFPLADIFPLRKRPFYNRWYPTPNSIESMISGYFPNTSIVDCVYYLHDVPFNQCEQTVAPCGSLSRRFAFTQTLQLPQGQLQYLIEKDASVSAVAFIAGADRL